MYIDLNLWRHDESSKIVLRTLAASAAMGTIAAAAQTGGGLLPSVPTTKVLAIGHLTSAATPTVLRSIIANEVRETVKLYLGGKIDQWYARKDANGVVFVMNVTTVEEAHTILEALPMGQQKVMEFELIPIGPLSPLSVLLRGDAPATPGAK